MYQPIELLGDAVCKGLTPVLGWAENEYRATCGDGLQTQGNYVTIIAGFPRHHRRPGTDGSQPMRQRAVVDVGS